MADRRGKVLAVRLDNAGDVLLTGPAVRAIAAHAGQVDLLVSPAGRAAAELLPGVDEVVVFDPPWSGEVPPAVDAFAVADLVTRLQDAAYDEAVVFTSYHQSPLPIALLAKLAAIPRVCAASEEYPGRLLDLRHRRRPDGRDDDGSGGPHEVEAALALAAAAGFPLAPDDDDRLRVRPVTASPALALPPRPYVVVHPGASVPTRRIEPALALQVGTELSSAGWHVVVTGGLDERAAASTVTPPGGTCLAGRTTLADLAVLLEGADAVVVGNTGPAHLAAAVGTPVVCLFAPVVPAARWAPWRVPHVLLGDQQAPCRGTRARTCPAPGHPCLSSTTAHEVVMAVRRVTGILHPHRAPSVRGRSA